MHELKTEEAKQARRDYYKQWRRKNPEKVRDAQERYWIKKFNAAKAESAGQ